MSTSDFLFQGNLPASWTTPSQTDSTSFPAWYQSALQSSIQRSSEIANQPYQPYQGPRIADTTPLMTDSYNGATMYKPKVQADFTQAQDLTGQAGQQFNRQDFNQFMSPYTDNVVNRIADLGARNLSEKLLPAVNDTFTGAGQFGSSRHADFTNRAVRDENESILGQQASALENAQNSAMSAYQGAQGRQLQAGAQFGNLGAQMGNEKRAELGLENQFGLQQQNQGQQNLNLAYSDFLNQQAAPIDQLNLVNSTIHGYTPSVIGQRYVTTPVTAGMTSNSPLQSIGSNLQTLYSGGQ